MVDSIADSTAPVAPEVAPEVVAAAVEAPVEIKAAEEAPVAVKKVEAIPFTEEKMKSLVVKDTFDVLDAGRWAKGMVKEVKEEGILVTYPGFKAVHDKTYTWDQHECICPVNSKVYPGRKKAAPKPKKRKKKAVVEKPAKKAKKDAEPEPQVQDDVVPEEEKEHIWVESPEGKAFKVEGPLSAFCREHGLNATTMSALSKAGADQVSKTHKGWKCWKANAQKAAEIGAKLKTRSTWDDIKERVTRQHVMKTNESTYHVYFKGVRWERIGGKLQKA